MKRFLVSILCTILLLCSCNSNTKAAPVHTSETDVTTITTTTENAETEDMFVEDSDD